MSSSWIFIKTISANWASGNYFQFPLANFHAIGASSNQLVELTGYSHQMLGLSFLIPPEAKRNDPLCQICKPPGIGLASKVAVIIHVISYLSWITEVLGSRVWMSVMLWRVKMLNNVQKFYIDHIVFYFDRGALPPLSYSLEYGPVLNGSGVELATSG
ncbi:hypothetical protein DAPPUDRAFT_245941 [Daphnia pulex]|uniref:Uncharacterized protein n=1 Tax=Daphnia pulex TaxID=6669 RepID=E9GPB8_DAPPU|nr:hypothetical protein DAPPUDRAFT_245941 [Daphnia pulex]|eukprot:EFX78708.1 hypothetical protein DAPPUDRAFT_245941 [Daphnia pulex]